MRLVFTILFLYSVAYGQTNYYVANAGNDTHAGTSPATAWQHLSKVNSSSFNPGDSILLNRGDSWNEQLLLKSSGSAGSPIIVSAYGNGVKPLITGFQTLTGFVNTSGNIWTVTATNSVKNLNIVLINGQIQPKGRYPNATATNGGYLTYSGGTQTSLTTSLTGTPNYTGKECVVRTATWVLDVVKVSSQSGGTLNFSMPLTYSTPGSFNANGFFFQNDSTLLDVQGEWSYDSASKRFQVYSTTSPSVQISTIDTLVYLNQHNYITFDNLSVQGANIAAFQFDSLSNITVQNSSTNYSGAIALSAQKCSYLSSINDSVQNSLSGGIYWRRVDPYTPTQDTCNFATISGNYIKNTGIYAGMGMNNNGRYMGIYVVGRKPQIIGNRVDSTGYTPIFFNGDTSLINNNFVSNYNLTKTDGGGIYTVVGGYIPSNYNNGSVIRRNIVTNGIGTTSGISANNNASGIYLDDLSKNLTVDSNSVYNCVFAGIFLHDADSNVVRYNNVYNGIGTPFRCLGSDATLAANLVKYNAFYSSSNSWNIIQRDGGGTNMNIDSNFYSRPTNETAFSLNGVVYNLSGWQTATGKDLNSKGTPSYAANASFYYNPILSDSTIYFTKKISLRGVTYTGSILLKSFTSAILFDVITVKQYQYKHYR